MTELDKSLAKIAWMSPHTCFEDNWKETKQKTITEIFPLIGTYYLFEKNKEGEVIINTIDNKISNIELPENYYERIQNERVCLVFKKETNFINNWEPNWLKYYKKTLDQLNIGSVGYYVFKGFETE